ncbi:DnaB-like helicase N-terminal domain-containing protein [Nitrosophilus labii]|uniref:DnaB-like helicase N-terminal domain-containing protein n=1 Tax=Nitrosophilus labii TaxID=2706014 RepID=UPI0016575664|nr:DnaB-like helicase N-terminal domain-containing protein [Nitrosophilus labii]
MSKLYNINIERAILSSFVFDPQLFEKYGPQLKPDHFFHPFHQSLFEAIVYLFENDKPIDEEFLKDYLEKHNRFNEIEFLEVLAANPLSNLVVYIEELKEKARKRKLFYEVKSILQAAEIEDKSSYEIKSNLISFIEEYDNKTLNETRIINIHKVNEIEEKEPEFWLKSWLPIPKNAITFISARGGSGKSFLLLQILIRFCMENPNLKAFGWLSEDTVGISKSRMNKIVNKIISLKNPEKIFDRISIAGTDTMPIYIAETNNAGVLKVSEYFYQMKKELSEFDLIIFDPLIAFYGGEENSNTNARYFMNLLNTWAIKENKTIVLSHHSRKEDNKVRGAGAFVDAVRLHYELKNIDKKSKNPDTFKTIFVEKDNWGVKIILGGDKVERQIFPQSAKNTTNRKEGIGKTTLYDDF